MISQKYIELAELANETKVNESLIVELCCNDRLPYLGIPIEPIFRWDQLDQIKVIIEQEGGEQ